jgi:hypothetical protein
VPFYGKQSFDFIIRERTECSEPAKSKIHHGGTDQLSRNQNQKPYHGVTEARKKAKENGITCDPSNIGLATNHLVLHSCDH